MKLFTDFLKNQYMIMVKLIPFTGADFNKLISWITNEELLIQIAGRYFTYPLTAPQLKRYLEDEKSLAFNIVTVNGDHIIGHAEIIVVTPTFCKIDKLIIGETDNRGKGLGGLVINELLQYCFTQLHAEEVELNVYDWNIAGIKCYTKAGFTDTGKRQFTEVGNETWEAINMVIRKNKWAEMYNK